MRSLFIQYQRDAEPVGSQTLMGFPACFAKFMATNRNSPVAFSEYF